MTGWKTILGGIGIILGGLAALLTALLSTPFDYHSVLNAVLTVFGGLAVIGLGHKLDKLTSLIGWLKKL